MGQITPRKTVSQAAIIAFCETVGINPYEVDRMVINNEKITVERDYPVRRDF